MSIKTFKEGFADIVQLCLDIPSVTLEKATLSISEEMDDLQSDDDMGEALSLLSELLVHVNDLDQEEADEYQDILMDINDSARDLRQEFI